MALHPNTINRIIQRRTTESRAPQLHKIFRKLFNFIILCKIFSSQVQQIFIFFFFAKFKFNIIFNENSFSYFRSCVQWWKVLPPPYKFFLILIALVVLLVSYLYLQKLVNYIINATDDGQRSNKTIPNPEYPLPPSSSILHQFKSGAVCSDSEQCSRIGRFVSIFI